MQSHKNVEVFLLLSWEEVREAPQVQRRDEYQGLTKSFNFDQTRGTDDCNTILTMANPGPRKILVVDDEAAIRTCLTILLESDGYDVDAAEDGIEALLLISTNAPDIVISDLNMPGMSGVDLLSEIRRRFPQVVTIAMSGAYENVNELPSEVLAHGFYAKGKPPGTLCGTLSQLLEGIRAPSA